MAPDTQTEDISNNALKASEYGIKNLQIVAENLPEWTSTQTNNYDDLEELYGELWSAWNRYVGHVNRYVGGVFETNSKPNQEKVVYYPLAKEKQRAAVQWLHSHVFETPTWLLNDSILNKIEGDGFIELMTNRQTSQLRSLLSENKLNRLADYHTKNPQNYSPLELISDIRNGIWMELETKENVSVYRRALQDEYIQILGEFLMNEPSADLTAIARGELNLLKKELKRADRRVDDQLTKYHYQNSYATIQNLLDTDS